MTLLASGPGAGILKGTSLRLKLILGISALTVLMVGGTVVLAGRVQTRALIDQVAASVGAISESLATQFRGEASGERWSDVADMVTDADTVEEIEYIAAFDTTLSLRAWNKAGGPYQEVLALSEFNEAWEADGSGQFEATTVDGRTYLVGLSPIFSFGVRYGGVLVLYDREYINLQVRELRRAILLLGLGALVAGILLSLFLARRFSGPVVRLTDAAVRIGSGDFGRTVKVETRDEIGTLAETFNTMSIELKKREGEVRRAERLSAIGTTASVIAHEMKTPLQSVTTYTEMLKFKFDDHGFRQKYADVVMPQITRLGSLVDDLLDYSRESRLSLSEVDLNIQLRQAVHFFGDILLSHDVAARESYEAEGLVSADPDRLDQIFFNLIRNAIEAQAEGGVVGVLTRSDNEMATVFVGDGGGGIPEEQQRSIFEPFFTTKSKGTGLGLAITQKLVAAHGGRIEVRSPLRDLAPGDLEALREVMAGNWPGEACGTCFLVTLPLAAEER